MKPGKIPCPACEGQGGTGGLGYWNPCDDCGRTGRIEEPAGPCAECGGRGRVTVPSYDMEVPAFSTNCLVCSGSGRKKAQ